MMNFFARNLCLAIGVVTFAESDFERVRDPWMNVELLVMESTSDPNANETGTGYKNVMDDPGTYFFLSALCVWGSAAYYEGQTLIMNAVKQADPSVSVGTNWLVQICAVGMIPPFFYEYFKSPKLFREELNVIMNICWWWPLYLGADFWVNNQGQSFGALVLGGGIVGAMNNFTLLLIALIDSFLFTAPVFSAMRWAGIVVSFSGCLALSLIALFSKSSSESSESGSTTAMAYCATLTAVFMLTIRPAMTKLCSIGADGTVMSSNVYVAVAGMVFAILNTISLICANSGMWFGPREDTMKEIALSSSASGLLGYLMVGTTGTASVIGYQDLLMGWGPVMAEFVKMCACAAPSWRGFVTDYMYGVQTLQELKWPLVANTIALAGFCLFLMG